MPRYKIIIEYLGTNLAGFQRQENALSIQELVESAILGFSRETVIIHAAGRTDAGVHAYGQVAHFDLEKYYDPYTITRAINHFLRAYKLKSNHKFTEFLSGWEVSILNTELVDEDFHARFSAKARHYLYKINNRNGDLAIDKGRAFHIRHKLDIILMEKAASYLIGKHDFTSFRATSCQSKSPIKTLTNIKISNLGEEIHFNISAPSFLHHMVRNIVGTLVLVGLNRIKPEDVKIALEKKDRKAAGPTAPSCGLYFMKVDY